MFEKTPYGWVARWRSQEVRVSYQYLDLLGERLIDHPEALEAMCVLAVQYRDTWKFETTPRWFGPGVGWVVD